MNKEVIVDINGRDVAVKKMPLGKYAEIFAALQDIPKHLEGMNEFSNEEFIQRLPHLISVALPELAKLVSIATEVPEKEIAEELGLAEITDLAIAILDVNEIEKVVENIKKIMARKVFQSNRPTTQKANQQVKKALTA